MAKVDCPKCGAAYSWFEEDGGDIIHRCLCGYRKAVVETKENIVIEHIYTGDKVKIPKERTKLWHTLMVLSTEERATSGEVSERLELLGESYPTSDVASYLTILKAKGLVEVVEDRKGQPGGSTWQLTLRAKELLGV